MRCLHHSAFPSTALVVVFWCALTPLRSAAADVERLSAAERDVLGRLASEDYQARQVTTERLLQDPGGSVAQLRRLYRVSVSGEQRHRLMEVAFHYTMRQVADGEAVGTGSGFIGIEMVPGISDARADLAPDQFDAVVVVRTFPGFPGHAHLRPADLILSVNDRRIDHETFTRRVGMIRPGQPVTLTVRRDGRTRRIRFMIGDRAALPRLYGPDGEILETTKQRLDRAKAVISGLAAPDPAAPKLGRGAAGSGAAAPRQPEGGTVPPRVSAPTQE